MSWRVVVISKMAKLSYKNSYLTVRNETTSIIHLSEINTIVIETTQVSITGYLLAELIKRKIKVIICDENRNPAGEVTPYYGSHNTSKRIANQVKWKENDKEIMWTLVVKQKIQNQHRVLEKLNKKEASKLERYIAELQHFDTTNREGHSAKVYFNALFGKGFSREESNDINAALDYGYTILLSAFNREIISLGCMTQLGIRHKNEFNHYNLSCDLMECFRPIVDEYVYRNKGNKFISSTKLELIDLLNIKVEYKGKELFLINTIQQYTKSIIDSLDVGKYEELCLYEHK